MLKYKKSRQPEDLEVTIDGKKLEVKLPGIRRVMHFVVEYIDTLKYIPAHLCLDQDTTKIIANLIIQSFADLFRGADLTIDCEPHKIFERITVLTQRMVDQVEEIIRDHHNISEEQLTEACKTFIPSALIKLQDSLFNDLAS